MDHVPRRFAMPAIEVRPFRRADREQVTALVNAHIETVPPGVSVSVNAVMSSLEREPDEYVVDRGRSSARPSWRASPTASSRPRTW
jgi:hypothetical protein